MQRLVSPELKVYTISGREALSELVAELRLHKTLAGNLRQLLGYQTVGTGRQARQMAGDWQLLESVRWPKHLESGNRKARSGRGQQCDPHCQTLLSTDSRRALT